MFDLTSGVSCARKEVAHLPSCRRSFLGRCGGPCFFLLYFVSTILGLLVAAQLFSVAVFLI